MDDPAPHITVPTPDDAAPADDVCPGATLGDYRLGALLTRGATADVYDATHRPSGTPRIVYVVSSGAMQDHPLVHRVVCEVDAARWLRHPAAAKVDGYGDAPGGRMYVAAERAPGRPLAERLAESGRLTPSRVVRLACRLVEALEEAHAVGLVHGRLTPEAVVVGDDADDAGAPLVTITGLGVGAVAYSAAVADAECAYVAPEQQSGAAADVRGDVFGLASVLWTALAGAPPTEDSDAPDANVPGAAVLRAARSAAPARRPASVRAFWEELLGALVADAARDAAGRDTAASDTAASDTAASDTAASDTAASDTAAGGTTGFDLGALALDAFELTDLELTPAPPVPAGQPGSPVERTAVAALEPAFGGLEAWAAPADAAPHAARHAARHAAPTPPPAAFAVSTHAAAYGIATPPLRARSEPPPARAYRWDGQHHAPARAARPPARPTRAWGAKQALPWWLAVPAVAAAAVGGPLARDWASPGAAPETPSAGEVVDTYRPPRVARHRRRTSLVELPADTAAAADTLPAVPWVDVPDIEIPAPAEATQTVVRAEDFTRLTASSSIR